MVAIHADDLAAHVDELLRRVDEDGESIDVLRGGRLVARLVPVTADPTQPATAKHAERVTDEHLDAFWRDFDRIGQEISASWPAGVSAVDAIRADRRW